MPDQTPILIAGGGIAGLATALALAAIGRPTRILERRTEFSEAGAGIQISPNGVRCLVRLGVADALAPLVGVPDAIDVRHGTSGRSLQRLPLGHWIAARHGAPYWVAHRRDLQAVLLAACRASPLIEIVTGFDLVEASHDSGGVSARSMAGHRVIGAALIGADGAFSRVRSVVAPGHPNRFSGRTAARTVVAAADVPADIDATATGVWIAPGAHIVHYPVCAGREIALVVIREEPWSETVWSSPVPERIIDAAVTGFAPPIRRLVAASRDWHRWALFDPAPLPRWSAGNVVVVGDAAHPVLPFLAQGGNLALEDALSLVAAVSTGPTLASAFEGFHRQRAARTARIAAAARRNGRIFHLAGSLAAARNLALRATPPKRVMAGYDWVYGWRPPA